MENIEAIQNSPIEADDIIINRLIVHTDKFELDDEEPIKLAFSNSNNKVLTKKELVSKTKRFKSKYSSQEATPFTIINGDHSHLIKKGNFTMVNNLHPLLKVLGESNNAIKYKLHLEIHSAYTLIIKIYLRQSYLEYLIDKKSILDDDIYQIFSKFIKPIKPTKKDFRIYDVEAKKYQAYSWEKYLTAPLYHHQRGNIKWMIDKEKMVTAEKVTHSYLSKHDLKEIRIPQHSHVYYLDKYKIIYDEKSLKKTSRCHTFNLRGGILSDEVGLGKTLSMIGLIISDIKITYHNKNEAWKKMIENQKIEKKVDVYKCLMEKHKIISAEMEKERLIFNKQDHNLDQKSLEKRLKELDIKFDTSESSATLIVCPNRICKQWLTEIEKFVANYSKSSLKVGIIYNIYRYLKYSRKDINELDILIISWEFLGNKRYHNSLESEKLGTYRWKRVIVDEGHEMLCYPRIKLDKIYTNLVSLTSKYRWVVSATPFAYSHANIIGMSQYLARFGFINNNPEDIFNPDNYRRNSRESLGSQIDNPRVYQITIFLNQTPEEKALYQSADKGTLRQIQLCTHTLISDLDRKVVGNDGLELSKIGKIFTRHHQKTIKDLETEHKYQLIKMKKELEEETDKDAKLKLENTWNNEIKKTERKISINQSKLNIFLDLKKKVKEVKKDGCCICFDEPEQLSVTYCGHLFCHCCITQLQKNSVLGKVINCPQCRTRLPTNHIKLIANISDSDLENVKMKKKDINRYGSKMAYLNNLITRILNAKKKHKIIIFSTWERMLKLVGEFLKQQNINYVTLAGTFHTKTKSLQLFQDTNNDDVRIILLSSENSSSGNNLPQATHIILLDTFNSGHDKSNAIETQAMGRAIRLNSTHSIRVYRLVMRNTIEEINYTNNVNSDEINECYYIK